MLLLLLLLLSGSLDCVLYCFSEAFSRYAFYPIESELAKQSGLVGQDINVFAL